MPATFPTDDLGVTTGARWVGSARDLSRTWMGATTEGVARGDHYALDELIAIMGGTGKRPRWQRVGRAVRTKEEGWYAVDVRELADILAGHVEVTGIDDELTFYSTFGDEIRKANSTWFWRCYDTVCKTGANGRSNAWNQDIRLGGGKR